MSKEASTFNLVPPFLLTNLFIILSGVILFTLYIFIKIMKGSKSHALLINALAFIVYLVTKYFWLGYLKYFWTLLL